MRTIFILILFIFNVSCGNARQVVQKVKVSPKVETIENAIKKDTVPNEKREMVKDSMAMDKEKMAEKELIEVPIEKFDHRAFDTILKTYVEDNGDVDYQGIRANKLALKAYLDALSTNIPTEEWDKNEVLAYWINAYNAFTIKLIVDNYPVNSIKDIKDPWGARFFKLGDKWYNLGEIEHKILRKMEEPRIHFAINCASYSCPRLRNEAYTAAKLEEQLQAMTMDFVTDTKRNIISADRAQLSNIFKWYKKDFTENSSLIAYINKYLESPIPNNTRVTYLKYDWSLNEAK
ncbi:MAG: DUF547 domain-containing protein [Bacteroidota bacterium]